MSTLYEMLVTPWPWYVSGPIIGSMVPLLILIGSRSFGISQNLEHLCAMAKPAMMHIKLFNYDWRASKWSIVFAVGVISGGLLAGVIFANPESIQLSQATLDMLAQRNIAPPNQYNPPEMFTLNIPNSILLLTSGVLIGFGTRYAAGCTSGHAITGLSTLQIQSVYAVIGIFAGGLLAAHYITPALGF